jgi:hypothetical protein
MVRQSLYLTCRRTVKLQDESHTTIANPLVFLMNAAETRNTVGAMGLARRRGKMHFIWINITWEPGLSIELRFFLKAHWYIYLYSQEF